MNKYEYRESTPPVNICSCNTKRTKCCPSSCNFECLCNCNCNCKYTCVCKCKCNCNNNCNCNCKPVLNLQLPSSYHFNCLKRICKRLIQDFYKLETKKIKKKPKPCNQSATIERVSILRSKPICVPKKQNQNQNQNKFCGKTSTDKSRQQGRGKKGTGGDSSRFRDGYRNGKRRGNSSPNRDKDKRGRGVKGSSQQNSKANANKKRKTINNINNEYGDSRDLNARQSKFRSISKANVKDRGDYEDDYDENGNLIKGGGIKKSIQLSKVGVNDDSDSDSSDSKVGKIDTIEITKDTDCNKVKDKKACELKKKALISKTSNLYGHRGAKFNPKRDAELRNDLKLLGQNTSTSVYLKTRREHRYCMSQCQECYYINPCQWNFNPCQPTVMCSPYGCSPYGCSPYGYRPYCY